MQQGIKNKFFLPMNSPRFFFALVRSCSMSVCVCECVCTLVFVFPRCSFTGHFLPFAYACDRLIASIEIVCLIRSHDMATFINTSKHNRHKFLQLFCTMSVFWLTRNSGHITPERHHNIRITTNSVENKGKMYII